MVVEGKAMDKNKAIKYITENARPLELAVFRYFFEEGSNKDVIDELSRFQNADGGFGHALEPDFFNPNSPSDVLYARTQGSQICSHRSHYERRRGRKEKNFKEKINKV